MIFTEYKEMLEKELSHLSYLYSGDIISSKERRIVTRSTNSEFSVDIINKSLIEIYQDSVNNLFRQSEEIVVHRKDFKDIRDLLNKANFIPENLFYSNNSYNIINQYNISQTFRTTTGNLPHYFHKAFLSSQVSGYHCPNIEDEPDDCHIYLSDKPIQSFVWILQNMEYKINRGFSGNEHMINFKVYECDFKSIMIRIVDTQSQREKKINQILNGN
jgi:hypothetical protein